MLQPSWKAFFIFSNKEIKGIIVLGILLLGSVFIRFLFPSKVIDVKALDETKITAPILHLVNFDPNTIDSLQAIHLGLPLKQVNNLLRYRAKGGYFKTAESFSKLYGLTPTLYNALVPYIKIGMSENYEPRNMNAAYNFKIPIRDDKEVVRWKIDMNLANETEWAKKTGLPNYLIQRIMAYKQYRGAFKKPSELRKVYGLSDSVYSALREHLEVQLQTSYTLNAHAMQFNDWKALAIFSEPQIWTILKLKRSMQGKLYWSSLVEALDLTKEEAEQLRGKVKFDD
jgi:hypothetical protein